MTLPFYPFYWGDYSSKTYDLTQGQHGAYVLFLRYVYTTGHGIPDKQWSSIARAMTQQEVDNARFVLETYFKLVDGFWYSDRAIEIMSEANEAHEKRVNAGKKGGIAKSEKSSNAKAMPEQSSSNQNHTHNQNQNIKTPTPLDEKKNGVGVFKDLEGGRGVFSIEHLMDDDTIMEARLIAKGLDVYHLMRVYDEGVNSGVRERPKYPKKAFIGWLPKYVKGFKK